MSPKHTGSCLGQESHLGLPHYSQSWHWTAEVREIVTMSRWWQKKKKKSLNQELNPGLPHSKQQVNTMSYPVCFKVEGIDIHKYLSIYI